GGVNIAVPGCLRTPDGIRSCRPGESRDRWRSSGPAFERVRKAMGRRSVRLSTASFARARDAAHFFVPQRIFLILSLSKDAGRNCSRMLACGLVGRGGARRQIPETVLACAIR